MSQSHAIWREGARPRPASLARRRRPIGTTLAFTLSQPASVTLAFSQRVAGRKRRRPLRRAGRQARSRSHLQAHRDPRQARAGRAQRAQSSDVPRPTGSSAEAAAGLIRAADHRDERSASARRARVLCASRSSGSDRLRALIGDRRWPAALAGAARSRPREQPYSDHSVTDIVRPASQRQDLTCILRMCLDTIVVQSSHPWTAGKTLLSLWGHPSPGATC